MSTDLFVPPACPDCHLGMTGFWLNICGRCGGSGFLKTDPEETTMTTTPTGPEAARMALRAGGAR